MTLEYCRLNIKNYVQVYLQASFHIEWFVEGEVSFLFERDNVEEYVMIKYIL